LWDTPPAARAVRCAADQGKFWELRTSLVRNASKLSPASITSAVTELKLDMTAFAPCIAGTRHDAEINADMEAARSLGIEGTPSFLLGRTTVDTLDGVLVIGAVPFEVFDAKIEELLAPAGKPVK
jgi:protein-disulfide isomerase